LQRVVADYLQRRNKPTRPGTYAPSPLQRAQTATEGALDPRLTGLPMPLLPGL
ncbi:unnamed protein product, partial [Cladocopium goreaui]